MEKIIGKFYLDKENALHSCCWDSHIYCFLEKPNKFEDKRNILECNEEDAEFILEALNNEIKKL